jgi:hypothetical protein
VDFNQKTLVQNGPKRPVNSEKFNSKQTQTLEVNPYNTANTFNTQKTGKSVNEHTDSTQMYLKERINEISNELEKGWKNVLETQMQSKEHLEKDLRINRKVEQDKAHLNKLKEEQLRLLRLLQSENGMENQAIQYDSMR